MLAPCKGGSGRPIVLAPYRPQVSITSIRENRYTGKLATAESCQQAHRRQLRRPSPLATPRSCSLVDLPPIPDHSPPSRTWSVTVLTLVPLQAPWVPAHPPHGESRVNPSSLLSPHHGTRDCDCTGAEVKRLTDLLRLTHIARTRVLVS